MGEISDERLVEISSDKDNFYRDEIKSMARELQRRRAEARQAPGLTRDVVSLVIAAREFWDVHNDLSEESNALDKALERFSEQIPYENGPNIATPAPLPAGTVTEEMVERATDELLAHGEFSTIPAQNRPNAKIAARATLEAAFAVRPAEPVAVKGDADYLTRPIVGIENRTAQEVFDIMADRIRSALVSTPAPGLVEALRRIIEAHDTNTGNEPSISVFERAIDEGRAALASGAETGGAK